MRILLGIIFFVFQLQGFSQFKVTHYNSENGLPHDLCYQITEDAQNYIWLGTDNGLVKFNGKKFENYTQYQGLTSNFVIGVDVDPSGRRIVSTWGGGIYLFQHNTFTPIGGKDSQYKKMNQGFIHGNQVYAVENRVRLSVYDLKNIRKEPVLLSLMKLNGQYHWFDYDDVERHKKEIYAKNALSESLQLVCLDNEVYCINDKHIASFKNIYKVDGSKKVVTPFPFLKDYAVIGLRKQGDHYLAITNYEKIEFNPSRIIKVTPFSFASGKVMQFSENEYFNVYVVENEKLKSHEVVVENKISHAFFTLTSNEIKAPVSDIMASKTGAIWVSTYGNGIFLLVKPQLQVKDSFLQEYYIFDYKTTPKYDFYLTTDKILKAEKGKKSFTTINSKNTVDFHSYSNDTLYIHTKYLEPYSFTSEGQIVSNEHPQREVLLDGMRFYNGDQDAFVVKDGRRIDLQLDYLPASSKPFLKIEKIIKFKKEYWMISNQGIFVLNRELKNTKRYSVSNGLASDKVMDAEVRNNEVWLLHTLGISRFSDKGFEYFPYVNDKNDAFNDFVIDRNGSIWLASQKGLVGFYEGQFYRYTKNEGLSSNFYSKLYIDKNGDLLCLGNKGVTVLNVKNIAKAASLKINLSTSGEFIAKNHIDIQPNQTFLLNADVVNFTSSEYVLQYQLNNEGWQGLAGNSIDFSNFSSGKYTIRFRARFPYSDWTYSPKLFVTKIPVWYLRWYVVIPLLLLLTSGFGYLVYLRFRNLRNRNRTLQNLLESNKKLEMQLGEMRQNIAQDFHDELGNKLAGITVMSDKLLHANDLKKSANFDIIERINKDSQDLFHGIRDFIWAIDSKNGTLEELIVALTDFGEELFQNSDLKFVVENEVEQAKFLLPHYWNRQLLLLFKEAMTNTYKHSKAHHATLFFRLNDSKLEIVFKDDGIGYDRKMLSRQNGLVNLQKRADKIKGQLEISSVLGVTVRFLGQLQ
ncbi:sensor histidine kinase [Flavobacterium pedocola]